jgi:ABC-type nitrate/sulfonate/bicarbonate transport system permease component
MKRLRSTAERTGSIERKLKHLLDRFLSIGFILLLIGFWEWSVRYFEIKNYILPAPSAIYSALLRQYPLLLVHTRVTVYEAVTGLVVSIGVALVLAGTMNRSPLIKRLLYPIFVISQTIPIIALAPLMMIWFGLGTLPKIIIVVLICFFPLVISMTEGLESVDQDLIDLMRVMGASPSRIFFSVQLPSALPSVFAGLRISATYSVMGAVIGEWLGAQSGLGVFMIRGMNSFATTSVFAAIVVVIVLSILMFKLVDLAAWLMMPWNRPRASTIDLQDN